MRSGRGIFWALEFLLSPLSMVYLIYVSICLFVHYVSVSLSTG